MTRRARAIDWTDAISVEYFVKHPERATDAAVKAMAQRLLDGGVTSPFGHHLAPGLNIGRPIAVAESGARMIVNSLVESTAVHSRSRGWMPHVMWTVDHCPVNSDDDRQQVQLLVGAEAAIEVADNLRSAADAAFLDVTKGPVEP